MLRAHRAVRSYSCPVSSFLRCSRFTRRHWPSLSSSRALSFSCRVSPRLCRFTGPMPASLHSYSPAAALVRIAAPTSIAFRLAPRKRPWRSNAPIRNYSETKRRKPQEPRPVWKAYMNSSKRAGKAARKDRLHTRIAWGQVTVDRIVQARALRMARRQTEQATAEDTTDKSVR